MSKLLEFKDVTKTYGKKEALKQVSFSLEGGKIVGLLGPNGSGKTTIIKMINGLIQPTNGEVFIQGNAPGVESKAVVSYLPDRTYLDDWMKVKDIFQMFADFYADFDMEKANKMLADLHIDSNDKLKTMSKGTKEKVQLILVMARRAKLYLLDEPIGGVDPAARDYILNTIIGNYAEDATVLISTHLIQDVEKIFDEVIFLKYGHIDIQGDVDDIRMKYGKSIDELFREVYKC